MAGSAVFPEVPTKFETSLRKQVVLHPLCGDGNYRQLSFSTQHTYVPGLVRRSCKMGMVVYACDPGTQKVEVGGLVNV